MGSQRVGHDWVTDLIWYIYFRKLNYFRNFLPTCVHPRAQTLYINKKKEDKLNTLSAHRFSSVAQSCPTLCDPMNCSTPGLSITNYQSSLRLMSIESAMPSSHLILCRPLLLLPPIPPSISLFQSQLFAWGGQSTGVSASASVLPMNIQDWSSLGLTGWISLQSNGLSRVFSSTIIQSHQFFGDQPSLWSSSHIHTRLLEKP